MSLPHPLLRAALGLAFPLALASFARADAVSDRLIGAGDPAALSVPQVAGPELWKDPAQPVEVRVQDLLRRMTLAEKTSQLLADAAGIPRLRIPSYSYRNEAIHGVAHAGIATVFPQTIGMAATWDTPLIHQEADVISTEARAKFNDYAGSHGGAVILHRGLSFYAPNINLVRDPRWGRGQETYGEDPFLTGQMAVAFIRGVQGDDPHYVKALATAKHFAVHSGPEPLRRAFNATPPESDLYDTYFPAFEAAIKEGHAGSVMMSYNALNGVPNCANPFLIGDILRGRWGFQGFVVSDGNALVNLWRFHHYRPTPEEAVAAAIKAGCDLVSAAAVGGRPAHYPQDDYRALGRMLGKHLVTEADVDRAVGRTIAVRFRLGLFDPADRVPWSKLTLADNDTPEHRQLARKVAEESIVLLKNDGVLPLDRAKLHRIAVIGPNAAAAAMLSGNYEGNASRVVTLFLDGIRRAAGPSVTVTYSSGCPLALKNDGSNQPSAQQLEGAVAQARDADLIIYVGGLDATLEQESHRVDFRGFNGGDRTRIELPPVQDDLIRQLQGTGKPLVLVNCSGSAIAMGWEAEHVPAIVQAWYPGEEGGAAVAEVLFGEVNPAGRLPITFYRSTADLPPFTDYAMANRTYRYFTGTPLYAFGHGLSYTRFDYSAATVARPEIPADGAAKLTFTVTNTGARAGDEVAQVYVRQVNAAPGDARLALCGFQRLPLAAGHAAQASFEIPARALRTWDPAQHAYVIVPGDYEFMIGGASDDIRQRVVERIAPMR